MSTDLGYIATKTTTRGSRCSMNRGEIMIARSGASRGGANQKGGTTYGDGGYSRSTPRRRLPGGQG